MQKTALKNEGTSFDIPRRKGVNKSTKLRDAISDLLKKNGTKACPDSPNFESGLYKR